MISMKIIWAGHTQSVAEVPRDAVDCRRVEIKLGLDKLSRTRRAFAGGPSRCRSRHVRAVDSDMNERPPVEVLVVQLAIGGDPRVMLIRGLAPETW